MYEKNRKKLTTEELIQNLIKLKDRLKKEHGDPIQTSSMFNMIRKYGAEYLSEAPDIILLMEFSEKVDQFRLETAKEYLDKIETKISELLIKLGKEKQPTA